MYEKLSLYINGQFISGEGRKTQDVINPATQEVLGQLPHASNADLDMALAAAEKAFATWKKSSPMDRSAILRKVGQLTRDRSKEIARNMTLDQGKPLAEALGEAQPPPRAARGDLCAMCGDRARSVWQVEPIGRWQGLAPPLRRLCRACYRMQP